MCKYIYIYFIHIHSTVPVHHPFPSLLCDCYCCHTFFLSHILNAMWSNSTTSCGLENREDFSATTDMEKKNAASPRGNFLHHLMSFTKLKSFCEVEDMGMRHKGFLQCVPNNVQNTLGSGPFFLEY